MICRFLPRMVPLFEAVSWHTTHLDDTPRWHSLMNWWHSPTLLSWHSSTTQLSSLVLFIRHLSSLLILVLVLTHFDDTRDDTVDDTLIRHSFTTHLVLLNCVIIHFSPRLVKRKDSVVNWWMMCYLRHTARFDSRTFSACTMIWCISYRSDQLIYN